MRPVSDMTEDPKFIADLRLIEALLFISAEPLSVADIEAQIDVGFDVLHILKALQTRYQGRGIEVRQIGPGWALRTAEDLSPLLTKYKVVQKKLSKAALETLAIIAYHQPVTRAEVEDVRGVQVSKGTLDVLLETGWVKMRGRRRAPGRPITYGTTDLFLDQFGFGSLDELPGVNELKGAGLLDGALPPDFEIPRPEQTLEYGLDEDPLDPDDEVLGAIEGEDDPLFFKDQS